MLPPIIVIIIIIINIIMSIIIWDLILSKACTQLLTQLSCAHGCLHPIFQSFCPPLLCRLKLVFLTSDGSVARILMERFQMMTFRCSLFECFYHFAQPVVYTLRGTTVSQGYLLK